MSADAMSAAEKLTIQALKDHDKVHPVMKAGKGPGTQASSGKQSGKDKKEVGYIYYLLYLAKP